MDVQGLRYNETTHRLEATKPQHLDQPLHLTMPVTEKLDHNAALTFSARVLESDPTVDRLFNRS